jgi:hypothetical protein
MTTKRLRTTGVLAAALIIPLTAVSAATPASAEAMATVSVLHAIPAGKGADVVDVYAGSAMLIDNFAPGTLKTLQVPGGTYDLAVFADGQGPGNGTAVLSAPQVQVPAGANATVTANLNAVGTPALNVFVNDTTTLRSGQGRLTVRHIAAAPAVDVRADGSVLFKKLRNGKQALANVPAGKYRADVVLAGTKKVVIGPATLTIKKGVNTIVYAWGSAADGSLKLAVQQVKTS